MYKCLVDNHVHNYTLKMYKCKNWLKVSLNKIKICLKLTFVSLTHRFWGHNELLFVLQIIPF